MSGMDPKIDGPLSGDPDTDDQVPIALDFVAHALLGGFRAHAVGRGECGLVSQRLAQLCGPHHTEMNAALLQVVRLLALRSQRRLHVHLPHCRGLSRDEMQWLTAVAEAQNQLAAPWPTRVTRMTELAGAHDPALEWAVANVAQVLTRCGKTLALPPQATPTFPGYRHDPSGPVTIH